RDIFFKFDSDEIACSKGFKEVENIASVVKKRDFSQVIVEGHTCSLGSQIYNRELSRKRAERIRLILISNHGIDPAKIIAIGKGEDKPLASNKSDHGRRQNRRVEFKIYRSAQTYSQAAE